VTVTDTLARRLAGAALVLCTMAALMIGALVATAQPASARPDPGQPVSEQQHFVRTLVGPGVGVSAAQSRKLYRAGQRVCEGLTAGVPRSTMTRTLVRQLDLSRPEARRLIKVADRIIC
jgi:hypothetical protein